MFGEYFWTAICCSNKFVCDKQATLELKYESLFGTEWFLKPLVEDAALFTDLNLSS